MTDKLIPESEVELRLALLLREVAGHVPTFFGPDPETVDVHCSCGAVPEDQSELQAWWSHHLLSLRPDLDKALKDFKFEVENIHGKLTWDTAIALVTGKLQDKFLLKKECLDAFEKALVNHDLVVVANAIAHSCKDPQFVRERIDRGDRLEADNAKLREALRKLCDKLDSMERPINACISISAIHGVPYGGPNWADEQNEARALLGGKT